MSRTKDKHENNPIKFHRSTGGSGAGERVLLRPSALLALLALLLTLIIMPKGGFAPAHYQSGDIVSHDIKSPRDMLIPDPGLTEKRRQEAEAAVPAIYDSAPQIVTELVERWRQALELLQPVEEGPAVDPSSLKPKFEQTLGVELQESEWLAMVSLAATPAAEELPGRIGKALRVRIVANLQLFNQDLGKGVRLQDPASKELAPLNNPEAVIGLGEALNRLEKNLADLAGLTPAGKKIVLALLQRTLRPNLTYNQVATEEHRQQAREDVKEILLQVKKGEMIVREGARITEAQVTKLHGLRNVGSDLGNLRIAMGMLIALLLLLLVGYGFGNKNISKSRLQSRDALFVVTTFVSLFILIKLSIFLATALEAAFPYIEPSSYYYGFPFAVGAMLVRLVLNSEAALLFAAMVSICLGLLFGNNLFIVIYALVGSLTGAHWLRHCKQRTSLYKAGFKLGLTNAALVVGLHFLAGNPFNMQLPYKLGFGFAGGLFCTVVVIAAIPLVEALFKYTTDLKLLELANLDNPLLRQLMVQAPGTYHHSVVVGNLAEAAAEAIGVNPLMVRVAAYYHDIGKVKKPLYFVENQSGHENKHDKLAPSMSALILMAHLKEGVELAQANRLGDTIIAVLRQHHGTALMKFFYDKAKHQADKDSALINEQDYRYPGPKPQSREAALIMLADAVEAAGRTLTDPTPARIQGMVQKIINNIFIDGQLDECNLTLKDLHQIARSFNRILAGIFHCRIDYPEPVHKEREGARRENGKKEQPKSETARVEGTRKNGKDTDREPAEDPEHRSKDSRRGSSDDLKRLGMS